MGLEPDRSNPFFERPILNSPYREPSRHWELDGMDRIGADFSAMVKVGFDRMIVKANDISPLGG